MTNKWVTSLRFNEIKNGEKIINVYVGFWSILFSLGWPRLLSQVLHQSRDFLRSDVSLGSQCGCHLRFFHKLCMRVVTKKLTMPAYCVATNCNNSQTTPGITMHELPRNQPTVRWKWIKFIQFKWADFLAAPHHAHLCSEHFSECDFTNPMDYRIGFALKLTRCSSTLSKSCLTGSNWYGCILVGLSGKVSVSSSELELAILQRLPRVT